MNLPGVTIAIPYFRAPDSIGRCVESALEQTYRNTRVVVVGDGETPPVRPTKRVTVYTLPRNHGGAPYAQQVALLATKDPWYAPLGADDWLDRNHISELLACRSSAVGTGSVWYHKQWETVVTRRMAMEVRYEVGLFAVSRLRAFGGYDPSERVAQDNLILDLLGIYGGITFRTGKPTYHRVKVNVGSGGMSNSAETGAGSLVRSAADARNAAWVQCARNVSADTLRRCREETLPLALRAELDRDVAGLRQWMP